MTDFLIPYNDQAAPGARLPTTVRGELSLLHAPASAASDLTRFRNLAPMRAALLVNRNANLLHIGHSITEGANATTVRKRWTDVLADGLRSSLGMTGGFGYAPAHNAYPALLPSAWTVPTGTAPGQASREGVGGYSRSMSAGSSVQFVFTGTAFRLFFTKYNGGPTVTVTIDGTAAASFSASAAASDYAGNVLYTGLTAGSHTVVVSTPGALNMQGAMYWNGDENTGIKTWNAGHSGEKLVDYVNISLPRQTPLWPVIAPSLVTIQYTINDYRQNVGVTAYGDALAALIDTLKVAIGHSSIVVLTDAEPLHGGTPTDTWASYKARNAAVAEAKGVPVIDLGTIPGLGLNGALMESDQVHWKEAGHAAAAAAIRSGLLAYA